MLAAITLVLVMGDAAPTVAMAQAVTEKSSGKGREQLQNAGAKVLVVSIQDMDLSDEQEGGILRRSAKNTNPRLRRVPRN